MTQPGVDVITQNVGENVRREQARELAASVVQAVFRLVKLSTLHAVDNQAMVRQVDETVSLVQEFCQRSGYNVSILFNVGRGAASAVPSMRGTILVSGQLLKANRAVYEGALELGEVLQRCGYSELSISRDIRASDLVAFASSISEALRSGKPLPDRPALYLRLRAVGDAFLRREAAIERMDDEVAAIVRAYATAIVIMRRFYEGLRQDRYALPQGIKRITQRLVDLSAGETPAFLGVTALRNQNNDDAGRAVNTAILSLAMARQITSDVVLLERIGMAALLLDTARARITGAAKQQGVPVLPQLSEQQELDVPAGTAVVLTTLGLVNEPSVMRTVMAYEAHWVKREAMLGPIYRGLRQATLQARIIATARAFNDLLTPAPGQIPLSADEAIAELEQSASDPAGRTVLRLLVGALGLFPTGTLVELSTGEVALVVRTPSHPALYSQPRVRLVLDPAGSPIQRSLDIDLAEPPRLGDPARHIRRVVATSDDPAAASMRAHVATQDAALASMHPIHPTHEESALHDPPALPVPGGWAQGATPGAPARVPLEHPMPYSSAPTVAVTESTVREEIRPGHRPSVSMEAPPSEPFALSDSYLPPPAELVGMDAPPLLDSAPKSDVHGQPTLSISSENEGYVLGFEEPPWDGPASEQPGSAILELPEEPATAEGTLKRTPLVHLFVYMLDRRLTGTTLFVDPDEVVHGIYFNDGVPAKVWTGTMVAPLDRVILDLGLLDEATLRDSLREISRRRVLHGRHLIAKGLLDHETVMMVLRHQHVRKLVALYDLPVGTRYAYYDGINILERHGGPDLLECEPLSLIMAGVRLQADDPLIDATLERMSNRQLALHIDAEMRRFDLHRDEAAVVDLLRTRRMTLAEMIGAGVAQERVVRLTVYALAITRHLDLGGAGRPPVGLGRERPAAVTAEPAHAVVREGHGRSPHTTVAEPALPLTTRSPSATSSPATSEEAPLRAGRRPEGTTKVEPRAAGEGVAMSRVSDLRGPNSPRTLESSGVRVAQPRAANMKGTADTDPRPTSKMPLVEGKPARGDAAAPPASARADTPAPASHARAPAAAPPPPQAPQARPVAMPSLAPPSSRSDIAARRADIESRAAAMEVDDFFQLLGVAPDAPPERIQSAYFALAKQWHPDRTPAELHDMKPLITRVFSRISEAYQTLNDPKRRAEYVESKTQPGTAADEEEKVARVVDAALEFQKAEILLKKRDLAGAEALARHATEADPDQPEYKALLAWILAQRRGDPPPIPVGSTSAHYDDLIEMLDAVLTKEPEYERALFYRGMLLKRSGLTDKAIRDFKLAAMLNPKNLDAVREVRLYEMRKRSGGDEPPPEAGGRSGLLGKLFKR